MEGAMKCVHMWMWTNASDGGRIGDSAYDGRSKTDEYIIRIRMAALVLAIFFPYFAFEFQITSLKNEVC